MEERKELDLNKTLELGGAVVGTIAGIEMAKVTTKVIPNPIGKACVGLVAAGTFALGGMNLGKVASEMIGDKNVEIPSQVKETVDKAVDYGKSKVTNFVRHEANELSGEG